MTAVYLADLLAEHLECISAERTAMSTAARMAVWWAVLLAVPTVCEKGVTLAARRADW